jgi:hypothetical protein
MPAASTRDRIHPVANWPETSRPARNEPPRPATHDINAGSASRGRRAPMSSGPCGGPGLARNVRHFMYLTQVPPNLSLPKFRAILKEATTPSEDPMPTIAEQLRAEGEAKGFSRRRSQRPRESPAGNPREAAPDQVRRARGPPPRAHRFSDPRTARPVRGARPHGRHPRSRPRPPRVTRHRPPPRLRSGRSAGHADRPRGRQGARPTWGVDHRCPVTGDVSRIRRETHA